MHQVKTNKNVRFDEPLSAHIQTCVTVGEKAHLQAVCLQNYITEGELIRNLIRDNIASYAITPELKKNLLISNKIDRILLEKRLISSRKETNLSKIREILTDFEAFCETPYKKIDVVSYRNQVSQLDELLKSVYETDEFLSQQIDTQYRRILNSKTVKALKWVGVSND